MSKVIFGKQINSPPEKVTKTFHYKNLVSVLLTDIYAISKFVSNKAFKICPFIHLVILEETVTSYWRQKLMSANKQGFNLVQ